MMQIQHTGDELSITGTRDEVRALRDQLSAALEAADGHAAQRHGHQEHWMKAAYNADTMHVVSVAFAVQKGGA